MAAKGVNKVILIGNLGNDPEVRYLPSGSAVTNFSMATHASWKDKQTGEMKEHTEWHRVALFDRLAEIAGEYLKKGSKVYVEGSLRTRKWQDNNGQDRYSTEILVNELQMLDSRRETNNQMNHHFDDSFKDDKVTSNHQSNQTEEIESKNEFDDDIPF